MNPYAEHAADLASLQDEQGDDCPTIFYGGRNIRVLAGGARNTTNNTLGGQSFEADFSGVFTIDQFATAPSSNEIFKYPGADGKKYKIDAVIYAAGRKQLRITAIDYAQSV